MYSKRRRSLALGRRPKANGDVLNLYTISHQSQMTHKLSCFSPWDCPFWEHDPPGYGVGDCNWVDSDVLWRDLTLVSYWRICRDTDAAS